jgi:spermidine/putrescine transport system ATP-binding protein
MSGFLVFDRVSKSFGGQRAVDDVSLAVAQGEVFSLLGPSGCGKTTLLRMAAGFEMPDSGRILLNGQDITSLPPEKRPVNTVFQNYALFPHLSVWENIAFGLRVAGRNRTEITAEVEKMLALTQLAEHARKRPSQLSGGQKQRVAIARALINKPQVLLLDEPLAALDLKLRQHMLSELHRLHEEVGITFVFVTHDQGEAMRLSDRIGVMNAGHIEQIGSPMDLYDRPDTRFVASFVGDATILPGMIECGSVNRAVTVKVEGLQTLNAVSEETWTPAQSVLVSVRPERIALSLSPQIASASTNVLQGRIEDVAFTGGSLQATVKVRMQSLTVMMIHTGSMMPKADDPAWLTVRPEDVRLIRDPSR